MRHASLSFGVRYCAIRPVLWLAFATAAFFPCFAQTSPPNDTNHALTCVLRDLAGHPLSAIAIELRSVSQPLETIRALTEADGSYTFNGLREGEYVVTAAGGLISQPQQVQIHTGQSTLPLRLSIEISDTSGRTSDLVSVQQLRAPTKAQQTLQKAIEAWSRNDTHMGRALTMRALEIQPDYAPALTLVGAIDLHDGNPKEAIAHLVQSLQLSSNSPRAYVLLASAYNQLQRNVEALDALSIAAKFGPGSWQLHYETGRAYVGQGRFSKAVTEFDQARQVSSDDNVVVRLGKAHALLGLQDYVAAREELAGILEKSPHGPYSDESRKLVGLIDSQPKQPAPAVAAGTPDARRGVAAAAAVRVEH
jgi:tetratricopeptide (TPR) repeat protein